MENRAIKFRVFDGEQMHYAPDSYASHHGEWHMNLSGLCYRDGVLQDVLFLQFTDQQDADGVDIYEGDRAVNALGEVGIVWWDQQASRYVIDFETWQAGINEHFARTLRVVGNIYEQQEA